MNKQHFDTLCIHGGTSPDPSTGSRALPVHRTTSFVFKDTAHAAAIFAGTVPGHIYSRISNPTQESLEERIALVEGGKAALVTASGTSAIFYAIANLARQGDSIVSASNLYGGSFTMFQNILPEFGIKTKFVKTGDYDGFAAAIDSTTRAIFLEMVGNPSLDVTDITAMADLAHAHGLPLLVDATFCTPALCRPLEHGADIVIHSLTKWMGGHGTALGGVVVDRGSFSWKDSKFSLYALPDPSFGGLRWGHDLPEALPPYISRMRSVPLRNLGACLSADNCWMFLQGLETLPLRMERHSSNGLCVARFLENHPKVLWVRYPGLTSDPSYPLAQKYLPQGAGGMVVFGIKGARGGQSGAKETGLKFINSLQLFSHLANVGDAKSLALHPASTTHSQMTEEQQITAGLAPELIRLSIGLEHQDDILADLEQALDQA